MRRVAFTFVHGINNGPSERSKLLEVTRDRLEKHGLLDYFVVPRSNNYYMNVAQWQSVGDFMMDLAALTKPEWRTSAIDSVTDAIAHQQTTLDAEWGTVRGELSPLHVVLLHSMGQPLGISALANLTKQDRIKVRTVVVSIGGPLGNRNPAFKTYLQWCTKNISWWNPSSSLNLDSWIDIHNPDDPICTDLMLGYHPVRGVTQSLKFDYPGKPDVFHPFLEHGSYFDAEFLYDVIRSIIEPKKQVKIK